MFENIDRIISAEVHNGDARCALRMARAALEAAQRGDTEAAMASIRNAADFERDWREPKFRVGGTVMHGINEPAEVLQAHGMPAKRAFDLLRELDSGQRATVCTGQTSGIVVEKD